MAGSDSLAVRRLAGELDRLGRRVANIEHPVGLGHSAIEAGSIDTYDGEGNLVGRTGTQHDGTHGSVVLDGPIPPVPTAPLVSGGPAQAVVTWDGTFEGDARVPLDFQTVQVYAALERDPAPDIADLVGVITSETAASVTVGLTAGNYRVALRTRAQSGRQSALSVPVSVTVLSVMDPEVVAELERQITGATARLDDLGSEVIDSGQTLAQRLAAIGASADGKTRTTPALTAPTGPGQTPGDLWFQFTDATLSTIVGTWTWSGTEWLPGKASHEVISSVDVGTLTVVGEARLKAAVVEMLWADVVRSRKITTDMLLVGAGANLLVDPYLTTKAAWAGSALVQATGGRLSGGSLLIPTSATQTGAYIANTAAQLPYAVPVEEGKKYRVGAWVRFESAAPTAAGRAAIYVKFWNPVTNAFVSSAIAANTAAGGTADTWTWLEGVVTVPAGTTHLSVGGFKQATHTSGPVRFDGFVVNAMADASLLVDGGILARHITASEAMWTKVLGAHKVTALEIETGDLAADTGFIAALTAASAFIERVRALGIRIEDADGDPVIDLTSTGPNYLQLYGTAGAVVASMSQDGGVYGRAVAASESLTYKGEELQTILDRRGRGIVGWGFAAASQINPSQGQEMGIVEVGFTAQAGRMYVLHCTEIPFYPKTATPSAMVNTDSSTTVRLRYTTDGTRPLVTSTVIQTWQAWSRGQNVRTVSPGGRMIAADPNVDKTFRLLLTHQASGWETEIPAWGQVYFYVEDVGPVLDQVGGASNGGASTAPINPPAPVRRYTTRYAASWWRSYGSAGTPVGGPVGGSYIAQGKSPYAPENWRSLIGFPTQIQADLAGATIESVNVYMSAVHWHQNSGGQAVMGTHSHTAAPGTFSHTAGGMIVGFGKPEAKWWALPAAFWAGLKSGSMRGLSLLAPSTAAAYYGYFAASGGGTPLIEITYTK